MPRTYWPALDGLRAVAVAIVLLAHAGSPYPQSGGVGVDLFFVLSGFLITGILSSEHARQGSISFRNFYARRMLRLAPCLLVTCGLFVLLSAVQEGSVTWIPVVSAITYTANWVRALTSADLGSLAHCWSLAIEEQYYLLWPLVVLALERFAPSSRMRWQFLFVFAGGLALYRLAMVGVYDARRIYFGLDTHMDGLVLGSALSYLLAEKASKRRLAPRTEIVLSYLLTPVAVVGLATVMYGLRWTHPLMGRVGFTLVAIAAAVIVADLVTSRRSLLAGMLSRQPLLWVGRISYGLYLLHFPLFHAIDNLNLSLSLPVTISLKIATAIVAAATSYYLVEIHALAIKHYFESPTPTNSHLPPAELRKVA